MVNCYGGSDVAEKKIFLNPSKCRVAVLPPQGCIVSIFNWTVNVPFSGLCFPTATGIYPPSFGPKGIDPFTLLRRHLCTLSLCEML